MQKGIIYYRCHTEHWPTACLREDIVEAAVCRELCRIQLSADERRYLQQELENMRGDSAGHYAGSLTRRKRQQTIAALKLRLSQIAGRICRSRMLSLTD